MALVMVRSISALECADEHTHSFQPRTKKRTSVLMDLGVSIFLTRLYSCFSVVWEAKLKTMSVLDGWEDNKAWPGFFLSVVVVVDAAVEADAAAAAFPRLLVLVALVLALFAAGRVTASDPVASSTFFCFFPSSSAPSLSCGSSFEGDDEEEAAAVFLLSLPLPPLAVEISGACAGFWPRFTANSTERVRPFKSVLAKMAAARTASSGMANLTNPKPRDTPSAD